MHSSTVDRNLGSKYFPPRLKQELAAIGGRPLTVVEAPMGYGKTVAINEHLRASGAPLLWTTATDSGENIYWHDFCRALRDHFPDAGETVESLARMEYPRDAVQVNATREILCSLPFTGRAVLVVDDYHLLARVNRHAEGGMGKLCETLARRGPEELRMVLVTRDAYDGDREMLELKELLSVISHEAFVLNSAEIMEYYRHCGVIISKAEAEELHAATHGWISALYLYLVRYSKQNVLSKPAAINTMVQKEVYAPLPDHVKNLLFAVYPTKRFTLSQADFLCREPGKEGDMDTTLALLQTLKKRNSFLSYEESTATYTLHAIFRELLKEKFDRLPRLRRRAIYSRCGEWHLENNDYFSAVECFQAAAEFERALEVLEHDLTHNLVTREARFFVSFFKACPEDALKRHLPAAFKYALAAFSSGDYQTFGEQMAWLNAQCAEKPENDPKAKVLRGNLELLRSFTAFNDIEGMSRHHRKALELLGGPTSLYGQASPWTLGSPSVLFMFYAKSGGLAESVRQMHECLPHYYALSNGHGSGGEYLLEAEALFNAGDFDGAAIACHRSKAMATANGQVGNVICALFLSLRMSLMAGAYNEAREKVQEMRALIRERHSYFLLHTADLCEGFMQATLGRLEYIPEWLRAGEEKRLYSFAGGVYYLIQGRAFLLAEKYPELIGQFSWFFEAGIFGKHVLFAIYGRIYMGIAFHALKKKSDALANLETALSLALPDSVIMPFVENYEALKPLLRAAGLKSSFRAGISRIHALGEQWEGVRQGILFNQFAMMKNPLTKREKELARLAATGKTYPEIAAELHIASTTVKKAFSLMFRKLGVSGRDELVRLLASSGLIRI